MKTIKQWKIMLGLAAIFLAGSVTGWMLEDWSHQKKKFKRRDPDHFFNARINGLTEDLNLSPEQVDQIIPILRTTGEDMAQIHRNTLNLVSERIDEEEAQIRVLLDPEQQTQLDECQLRRHQKMNYDCPTKCAHPDKEAGSAPMDSLRDTGSSPPAEKE